jgi:uncharacterized protein DUF3306
MSEPETFFSRWSRLKSESGSEEGGIDEKPTADALPRAEPSSPPVFDPASLPPIESIGADSDIRLFLQAGVPAELARAALRSMWTADPSIRDFIGIAESQWDFNDPATIPGFGSLGARDCALAARALQGLNNAADEAPQNPAVVEQPSSTRTEPKCCEPVDEAGQFAPAPAERSQDADLERQVAQTTGEESVTQRDAAETPVGPRMKRSHGSALPK